MFDTISRFFSADPAVWVLAMAVGACVGACAGAASALFVRAYTRLFRLGNYPDMALCMWALRVAYCRPLVKYRYRHGPKRKRVYARRGYGVCRLFVRGPALALALSFALLFARYGASLTFAGLAVACILLVNVAWLDYRTGLLPDTLTYPLLWTGLMLSWLGAGLPLRVALAGVFAGYVFLSLCVAAFRLIGRQDVLGGGDVKLLAGLGAWLGISGLFVVLLVGCLASVVWAMWHQRTWRPEGAYPLGPFLVFPALCVLCLMPQI